MSKLTSYILAAILVLGLAIHPENIFAADPITMVTYPLLNRPVLQVPGGQFTILCSAGAVESGWQAKLHSRYCGRDLQVSSFYDTNQGRWNLTAIIPSDTPFELYNLIVANSSGAVDTVRNAVRIIPSFNDTYYIIHLPDTHLPSVNWYGFGHKLDDNTELELKQIIKEFNVINPEFILQTGDLINNGQSEEEFELAQQLLCQSEVPIFVTGGNHDLWYDGHDNWQRYFGETMDYSFNYGSTHFSGLEMYNVPTVTFTAEQMTWLSRDLKTSISRGNRLRILFYHFDESRQIDGNFVDDHQVDMILYGHTHRNGVDFLGSRQAINANTSYTMTNNGEYRLIKITNGRIDAYPVLKFRRLIVDYTPSNDGSNWLVQANIDNQNPVSFENGQLKFIMPYDAAGYDVEGGNVLQVVDWQDKQVYYVTVNIDAESRQTVTVRSKSPQANQPPIIETYHPRLDTSIYVDQTLAMRIQAADDFGPLQYSWFVDGIRVPNNNNPNFLLSPLRGFYGVKTIEVNVSDGTFHADHYWEIEILKSEGELQLTSQINNFFQREQMLTLEWLEPAAVEAYLEYGLVPGDYSLGRISETGDNQVSFIPNDIGMTLGIYYCRISDGNLSSREFTFIIESPFAPRMLNPIGPVASLTPLFSWQPIPGVPYYLVLVSDQEITIRENPVTGSVNVEGANPIWSILTAENSVQYGTPDPSGTFTSAAAPLVAGAAYWWTVLNCYGDSPELTSPVQSGFSSFIVDVQPAGFDPPVPLSPVNGDSLTESIITFTWTPVDGANGYRLYPFKIEQESGIDVARPLWDNIIATTNTFWDYDASSRLLTSKYRWKVAAVAENGVEALSDACEFYYHASSATVHLHTFDDFGTQDNTSDDRKLPRVKVRYTALEGINTGLPVSTDLGGDRLNIVLSPGRFVFTVEKEGFATLQDTIRLTVNEVRHINLRLSAEPRTLTGRVVDDQGVNVAAATIVASNSLIQELQKRTSSDHEGNFVLALSPGVWQITAQKRGFQSSNSFDVTVVAGENSTLETPIILRRNHSKVYGFVVNSAGQAVREATATLRKGTEQLSQTTNGQGRFEFSIAPGTWETAVKKDGYVSPPVRKVVAPTDSTVLIEPNLVLIPNAAIVTGTVSDATVLLKDVEVRATQPAGTTINTKTDGFGHFSFNLAPGNYTFRALKTGYTATTAPQIQVGPGETIGNINLELTANNCLIDGRVTSNGLTPISRAVVTCGSASATTSNSGLFELSVEPGCWQVSATKEGFVTADPVELRLGPGQEAHDINFVLMPNASIVKGKITSSLGPVAEATVTAIADRRVSTQSDGEGKYLLSLENGFWRLVADKDGFSTATIDSFVIGVGQTVEGVDFTIVPQIATVYGIISDTDGNPLRGASVQVLDTGISTTSKSDGTYTLTVSAGVLTIVVTKSGYQTVESVLTNIAPLQEVVVNFRLESRPCSVSGKIIDDTGLPVPSAYVVAIESGDSTRCITKEDGSYTLDLLPGSYYLRAYKLGYIAQTEELHFDLISGESRTGVDLVLKKNFGLVTGLVSDSTTGEPIAGVRILIKNGHSSGGTSTTFTDGRFSIADAGGGAFLIPSTYTLIAEKPGYRVGVINNLQVVGGSETQVEITMAKTMGKISGVVLADGQAVSEATIYAIHHVSGQRQNRVSAFDGAFSFNNIPLGKYDITASKAGYTSCDTVTVDADGSMITFNLITNQGAIIGVVIDSETGLSLSEVTVTINDEHGNGATTTTNFDGAFELVHLVTSNPYRLCIMKQGYSEFQTTGIYATQTNPVIISLSRVYSSIKGRVVTENNQGMANAEIRVQSATKIAVDTSNANGSYEFTKLPAGEYLVSVRKVGYLAEPQQQVASLSGGGEMVNVDFVMEKVTIETICINGPKDIPTTEPSQFSYVALTTDGRQALIEPEWSVDKYDAVANLTDTGKLRVKADYIGPLKLIVRDRFSGVEGFLHISALHHVTSTSSEMTLKNYGGASLYLPAQCMERPAQLRLSYPLLPEAMRNMSKYTLVGKAYEFYPIGVKLPQEATVILPIPEHALGQNCLMAHWRSEKLRWETLGGQMIGTDAVELKTQELGRFVLQSESEPLGITNVSFLPNPFSPITGPLKISYDLSSDQTSRPYVTIKLYNLAGDLIRTLVDNEPRIKGAQEEEWDGMTDAGGAALNGRYVVQMEAKDRSGVRELLKTVVLIK